MGNPLKPLKRGLHILTHPKKYLFHPVRAGKDFLGIGGGGKKSPAEPIPYTDPTAAAAGARDKQRRLAMRANGISSTQRSGAARPYSAAPKSLLGS